MSPKYLFLNNNWARDQRSRKEQRLMHAHVQQNYFEKRRELHHVTSVAQNDRHVQGGTRLRFRLRYDSNSSGIENRGHRRQMRRYKDRNQSHEDDPDKSSGSEVTTIAAERGIHLVASLGYPDSRGIDPFGALPFYLTLKDSDLLQRFQRHERWPWCPINGRSEWALFTVSDELVFRVTMYAWNIHMLGKQSGQEPSEWLRQNPRLFKYKATTISIINKRLSDPETICSDEVIAAVAALTNAELAFGSMEDAATHIKGLHALVRQRGGLKTLETPRQQLIQRLAAWNDFLYAELCGTVLVSPPLDLWDQSWHLLAIGKTSNPSRGLSGGHLVATLIPNAKILAILLDIRLLCELEAIETITSLPDNLAMRRGDAFHKFEWQLKNFIDAVSLDLGNWRNQIVNVVALASLIYVHHCLRGNPLTYRHFSVLVPKLLQGLQSMEDHSERISFAPLTRLWVLAVGAVTSKKLGALHDVFVSKLLELCIAKKFGRYDYIRSLQGFLWCGVKDEERFGHLWDEIIVLGLENGSRL